jgi:hypothetical protein
MPRRFRRCLLAVVSRHAVAHVELEVAVAGEQPAHGSAGCATGVARRLPVELRVLAVLAAGAEHCNGLLRADDLFDASDDFVLRSFGVVCGVLFGEGASGLGQ